MANARTRPLSVLLLLGAVVAAGAVAWWLRDPHAAPLPAPPAQPPSSPTLAVAPPPPPDVEPPAGEPSPTVGEGRGADTRATVRFLGPGLEATRAEIDVAPEGDEERIVTLQVTAAAPHGELPMAAKYEIVDVRLDGWQSDQWFHGYLEPTADGFLEIAVRLRVEPVLTVTDASTGSPVKDAVALRVGRREDILEKAPAPGPDPTDPRRFRSDDRGEIALPPSARTKAWWVGAPGRAWTRALAGPERPEVSVPLEPGGSVRVEVERWSELDDPVVLVARGESSAIKVPVARRGRRVLDGDGAWVDVGGAPRFRDAAVLLPTTRAGVLQADGLPPGEWTVGVGRSSRGLWLDDTWGTATFSIEAGRVAEVRLVPEAIPKPGAGRERVAVQGVLVVPATWSERPDRVHFRGIGPHNEGVSIPVEVTEARAGAAIPFEVNDLVAGAYELTVYPHGWTRLVLLPRDAKDLRLEVPPPVTVRVRVVDDARGTALPTADVVLWHRAQPPLRSIPPEAVADGGGAHGDTAPRDPTSGLFVGRVYAGQVHVEARARGYASRTRIVTLEPSVAVHDIEVRLTTVASVVVRVVRGGEVVRDAIGKAHLSFRTVRENGSSSWQTSGKLRDGIVTFASVEPRSYECSCVLEGGPLLPDQHIEVRRGEALTVDFDLPAK